MACDFCAWGDPIWAYPCKDFETKDIEVTEARTNLSLASFRHWLACFECSNFIEEENLNELAIRSFRSAVGDESRLKLPQRAKLMQWVRDTHLQFMRNRTGAREPYNEEVHK